MITKLARTSRAISASSFALSVGLAAALTINLQPWLKAGAMVTELSAALESGDQPAPTIARWAVANRSALVVKDGVPREYDGVGVFINGYEQFTAMHSRAPAASSTGR